MKIILSSQMYLNFINVLSRKRLFSSLNYDSFFLMCEFDFESCEFICQSLNKLFITCFVTFETFFYST